MHTCAHYVVCTTPRTPIMPFRFLLGCVTQGHTGLCRCCCSHEISRQKKESVSEHSEAIGAHDSLITGFGIDTNVDVSSDVREKYCKNVTTIIHSHLRPIIKFLLLPKFSMDSSDDGERTSFFFHLPNCRRGGTSEDLSAFQKRRLVVAKDGSTHTQQQTPLEHTMSSAARTNLTSHDIRIGSRVIGEGEFRTVLAGTHVGGNRISKKLRASDSNDIIEVWRTNTLRPIFKSLTL